VNEDQDAFGRALLDWTDGRGTGDSVVERDDGFVTVERGGAFYGSALRRWEAHERGAIRFARGRVLDVGCGAGRVALHLQARGLDVVGIDVSPLAVEAARRRGVRDARVVALEEVDGSLGQFDTIVLYGNNIGLLTSRTKARRLLRRLHGVTTARGRILGGSMDVRTTDDPDHLAYQERNARRGRLPGQLRLRVRYRRLVGPWIDWLFVSKVELEEILRGTGWHVARSVDGAHGRYVAVLEKD
jgi:SAM-dependent methyltransferase